MSNSTSLNLLAYLTRLGYKIFDSDLPMRSHSHPSSLKTFLEYQWHPCEGKVETLIKWETISMQLCPTKCDAVRRQCDMVSKIWKHVIISKLTYFSISGEISEFTPAKSGQCRGGRVKQGWPGSVGGQVGPWASQSQVGAGPRSSIYTGSWISHSQVIWHSAKLHRAAPPV